MEKKSLLDNHVFLAVVVIILIVVLSLGLDTITGNAGKKHNRRVSMPAGQASGVCRDAAPRCDPGLSCVGTHCISAGALNQLCRNQGDPAGRCNTNLGCNTSSNMCKGSSGFRICNLNGDCGSNRCNNGGVCA